MKTVNENIVNEMKAIADVFTVSSRVTHATSRNSMQVKCVSMIIVKAKSMDFNLTKLIDGDGYLSLFQFHYFFHYPDLC